MNNPEWYSAKLRFAVMVEPVGSDHLYDRVFLFRATDFDTAFERAISIGEAQQDEYSNHEGRRIVWKFTAVMNLDIILDADLDGAEICAESHSLAEDERIPFAAEFKPRLSKPDQTL